MPLNKETLKPSNQTSCFKSIQDNGIHLWNIIFNESSCVFNSGLELHTLSQTTQILTGKDMNPLILPAMG